MPKCPECGKRWSWKETVKASFTLDTGMTCPCCGKKQYLTKRSRRRMAMLNFLVLLPLLYNLLFDPDAYIIIGLFLGTALAVLLFIPYMTELTNQNELQKREFKKH